MVRISEMRLRDSPSTGRGGEPVLDDRLVDGRLAGEALAG